MDHKLMRLRKLREAATKNARCNADAVAAAFYRDNSVQVVGYNGPPTPMERCADLGCDWVPAGVAGTGRDHARHLHAEVDAITKAAAQGIALAGCDVMITRAPCPSCALALIAVRVRAIYLPLEPGPPEGWVVVRDVLRSAGIRVFFIYREEWR